MRSSSGDSEQSGRLPTNVTPTSPAKPAKKPADIDEYIAAQPPEIQPLLGEIRAAIRAAAPEATERISCQMPTFWQGENLIHFAAFKNHIGIYPGGEATGVFAEQLTGYKTSKGAIQLPLGQPIPLELIAEITRWRVNRSGGRAGT